MIIEDATAPRLEPEMPELPPLLDPAPRAGGAVLALGGVAVLVVGFAGLQTANFVVEQFTRSDWLGWVTLAVAGLGFGLLLAGVIRELRGLFGLSRVDRLRADLASGDGRRVHAAARRWTATMPEAGRLVPAIDAVNDPDAILALLRAGPVAEMQAQANALGWTAARQMVAGLAAMPAPALAVPLVAWRGIRLVRQVAALYGVRPGLIGTLRAAAPQRPGCGLGGDLRGCGERADPRAAVQSAAVASRGGDGGRGSRGKADGAAGARDEHGVQPAAAGVADSSLRPVIPGRDPGIHAVPKGASWFVRRELVC